MAASRIYDLRISADSAMKNAFVWITLILAFAGNAAAETSLVPSLDQDGHKGDIARLAKEKAMSKFDGADMNKDGKLSKEELAGSMPYLAKNFEKVDADKDGYLSWEEFIGHSRWPK